MLDDNLSLQQVEEKETQRAVNPEVIKAAKKVDTTLQKNVKKSVEAFKLLPRDKSEI